MKRFAFYLLVSSIITLTGCCKDDQNPSDMPLENYALQAKVDNKPVTIDIGGLSAEIWNNAGNAGSALRISGSTNTSETFTLQYIDALFLSKDKLETGQVTDFKLAYSSSESNWFNEKYDLTGLHVTNPDGVPDGKFVIEGISETNIWGTFSFVGYNTDDSTTIQITEGKFNAEFKN